MASWRRVLYTGITNNLDRRVHEHKMQQTRGFTAKYNVTRLVYYEHGNDVLGAIAREKEIKAWRREKKIRLIESLNPEWNDLSEEWS
jgi:putative endonuclease